MTRGVPEGRWYQPETAFMVGFPGAPSDLVQCLPCLQSHTGGHQAQSSWKTAQKQQEKATASNSPHTSHPGQDDIPMVTPSLGAANKHECDTQPQ